MDFKLNDNITVASIYWTAPSGHKNLVAIIKGLRRFSNEKICGITECPGQKKVVMVMEYQNQIPPISKLHKVYWCHLVK